MLLFLLVVPVCQPLCNLCVGFMKAFFLTILLNSFPFHQFLGYVTYPMSSKWYCTAVLILNRILYWHLWDRNTARIAEVALKFIVHSFVQSFTFSTCLILITFWWIYLLFCEHWNTLWMRCQPVHSHTHSYQGTIQHIWSTYMYPTICIFNFIIH